MTNNKLTDERVPGERIDAIIRSAERYLSRRGERDFSADGVEETIAALRELQEYRKGAQVEINDEMAFAFCRAISDDAVGADEVEDIKTGLRAAFANITTVQPDTAVEVRPIAFFDGDISPEDAEKLTAVIRELNNAPSEPAILAAVEAVPVVSEDLYKIANHIASTKGGLPDEWQNWAEELETDIRRAAMLQLFGNSEHVSNRDELPGWIKCSERMPEDSQWCAVNTDYGYYVQCWSDGQGWLGDEVSIPNCDVTHWMPLPAAPKQEVKSEAKK